MWHDAPKLHTNADDVLTSPPCDTPMTESSAAAPSSSDAAVPKRYTMQAVVQIAGVSAKALFDSGAGAGNYISKRYCSLNGIKLSTAATPITGGGVTSNS